MQAWGTGQGSLAGRVLPCRQSGRRRWGRAKVCGRGLQQKQLQPAKGNEDEANSSGRRCGRGLAGETTTVEEWQHAGPMEKRGTCSERGRATATATATARGAKGVLGMCRERVLRTGKQSQLTIFCDATGAGSSLYFRDLSGGCFCDMTVVIARAVVVKGSGRKGPGFATTRVGGGGCSSVACAISRADKTAD